MVATNKDKDSRKITLRDPGAKNHQDLYDKAMKDWEKKGGKRK